MWARRTKNKQQEKIPCLGWVATFYLGTTVQHNIDNLYFPKSYIQKAKVWVGNKCCIFELPNMTQNGCGWLAKISVRAIPSDDSPKRITRNKHLSLSSFIHHLWWSCFTVIAQMTTCIARHLRPCGTSRTQEPCVDWLHYQVEVETLLLTWELIADKTITDNWYW